VICVSWVVNATAYSVMDYNDSILIPEFSTFLRNYIVEKLYLKYENQFDDINIGSINTKLNLLPHNLSNFLNIFLNYVFPRIFIIFLIMIYFFYLDIRIGAILMCGSSLFYILLKNAIFDCVDIFVERSNEYEHISEIHKDKISNLFSIYSSNKMKDEIKENNEIGEDYKKIFTSSLQCTNKLKIISYVINILLFFCINATTIYLFLQKKISVGVVISIFMTVIYLLQYLMDISYWTPKLVEYYGYIQASEDFMDDLNSIVPDNRPPIRITEGVIQFIDVSFDYDGHDLFQHINLTLPANHKICIVGKSGSGKSTFIKLIMGYYPIKSGSLLIDSQNINDCNVNSIRQHISYVHQNIILFNKTIYENIVYGSPEHSVPSRERVIEVIHSMNLDKVFQNGIDVGVGVNGNKISGGQKQVVFILRELFSDKKIMILDEPTSALDGEHKQIILEFVKKITGKNVIVISHDNDFLHYVDTGYLLKDGHLLPIPIR
jgi:ABC-type multidrug transport system fused ATPase/permease subunit